MRIVLQKSYCQILDFLKKIFIYKEKRGVVTKVELVKKIKILQLYFETLKLLSKHSLQSNSMTVNLKVTITIFHLTREIKNIHRNKLYQ